MFVPVPYIIKWLPNCWLLCDEASDRCVCVLFSILKQCSTTTTTRHILTYAIFFPYFGLFFVCRPILFTTNSLKIYSPRSNMRYISIKIKEKMYIELAPNLINNIDRFYTAYGFLSLLFILSNNIRNLTFCLAIFFSIFIPSLSFSYLVFFLPLTLKELRSLQQELQLIKQQFLEYLVSLPSRSRRWRLETCWWSSLTWWRNNTFKMNFKICKWPTRNHWAAGLARYCLTDAKENWGNLEILIKWFTEMFKYRHPSILPSI